MPSFTFDKKRRTYFKDGRPVPPETLRAWAAEVTEAARSEMKRATERLIAGEINRPAWAVEMRQLISRSHSALWMLAQGGKEAMDAAKWGAVGQRVKAQADFLRGFERDLANERAGSGAQVLARAQLYANPLHATYQAAVVGREREAGVRRVARVLGESPSGHCDDCPVLAGEYDIDEVPEIGASACGASCNCEVVSLEAA